VEVQARNGTETWVLIHVEVQGGARADFAERMYIYNYRIYDLYHKDVVSLGVLTDTSPGFRPALYHRERWGCTVDFRFPTVKLLDWVDRWAELEASDNLFALVVMAQLRAKLSREGENRRKWKYRLLQSLYDRGCDRETIQQLFRVIDWMIRLPEELERQLLTDIYRLEEERHMPYVTSAERFGMERGHALGMEKGMQQGIEKGRQEGRQEVLRQGEATILLRLVELKFGAAAARAHRARIESADIDSLQQWSERILSAQAVDELFV
jgi:hypothetical protein